jgi:hypothetical protein
MSAQKKNNLMELRNRQLKLKLELKDQEAVLNSKLKMLEDNFGLMTINSVLPIPAEHRAAVSSFFDKSNSFIGGLFGKKEKSPLNEGLLKSGEMLLTGLVFKILKKYL